MTAFEKLSSSNRVTPIWILGHQVICGNDVVDDLAKEGSANQPNGQIISVPFPIRKMTIGDRWSECILLSGKPAENIVSLSF